MFSIALDPNAFKNINRYSVKNNSVNIKASLEYDPIFKGGYSPTLTKLFFN